MEYLLKFELKYFSQYMDNIPVINGIETHMSKLDFLKWKHYSTKENFIFQLAISQDKTFSINILMNGSSIIDSVELNIQNVDRQTFKKIQFSVNCPMISCKYFNHDSMSNIFQRRFQMTLRYESDFSTLTNILRQMGFIVKNAKLLNNKVEKEHYSLNNIAGNIVSPLVESSFISSSKDNSYFKHLKSRSNNTNVDETIIPLLETQSKDFVPRSIVHRSIESIAPNTNIPDIFCNHSEQNTFLLRVENSEMNKNCLQENSFIETFGDSTSLINSNLEEKTNKKNEINNRNVRNNLDKDLEKGDEHTRTENSGLPQNRTYDQDQKQTISQNVVPQKEACNVVSNNDSTNQTGNLRKKVHITRKLIKTKLKDKKFRKLVCINYY